MAKQQLTLKFGNKHGGWRKGAGRKPKGETAGVKHRRREEFVRRMPVMVTQRVASGLTGLRRRVALVMFRRLVAKLSDERFAVVEWSLQTNHVHLIVEAEDSRVLARKLGGFFGQFAKELNRLWGRGGEVFPDRFDARVLRCPAAVRTALIYVLGNARKHGAWRGRGPDVGSSGESFEGWADWVAQSTERPRARTWLLRTGWKKHGLIPVLAQPASEQDTVLEAERLRTRRRATARRGVARAGTHRQP
jgi:REP element-mobilizing transposase RayT